MASNDGENSAPDTVIRGQAPATTRHAIGGAFVPQGPVTLHGVTYELGDKLSVAATGQAELFGLRDRADAVLKVYFAGRDPKARPSREALQRYQTLRSPHLMRLLDFGYGADGLNGQHDWELLERLEPLSLPLPGTERNQWLEAELAPAMEVAIRELLRLRLVHCDIKPSNLMQRSGSATPVVVDLGSLKELDEATGESVTTIVATTSAYAAPELLRRHLNAKTDLFSLGMTLLEYCDPGQLSPPRDKTVIARISRNVPVIEETPGAPRLAALINGLTRGDVGTRWGVDDFRRSEAPSFTLEPIEIQGWSVSSPDELLTLLGDATLFASWCEEAGELPFALRRWINQLAGDAVGQKLSRTVRDALAAARLEHLSAMLERILSPDAPLFVSGRRISFDVSGVEGILREVFGSSLTGAAPRGRLSEVWRSLELALRVHRDVRPEPVLDALVSRVDAYCRELGILQSVEERTWAVRWPDIGSDRWIAASMLVHVFGIGRGSEIGLLQIGSSRAVGDLRAAAREVISAVPVGTEDGDWTSDLAVAAVLLPYRGTQPRRWELLTAAQKHVDGITFAGAPTILQHMQDIHALRWSQVWSVADWSPGDAWLRRKGCRWDPVSNHASPLLSPPVPRGTRAEYAPYRAGAISAPTLAVDTPLGEDQKFLVAHRILWSSHALRIEGAGLDWAILQGQLCAIGETTQSISLIHVRAMAEAVHAAPGRATALVEFLATRWNAAPSALTESFSQAGSRADLIAALVRVEPVAVQLLVRLLWPDHVMLGGEMHADADVRSRWTAATETEADSIISVLEQPSLFRIFFPQSTLDGSLIRAARNAGSTELRSTILSCIWGGSDLQLADGTMRRDVTSLVAAPPSLAEFGALVCSGTLGLWLRRTGGTESLRAVLPSDPYDVQRELDGRVSALQQQRRQETDEWVSVSSNDTGATMAVVGAALGLMAGPVGAVIGGVAGLFLGGMFGSSGTSRVRRPAATRALPPPEPSGPGSPRYDEVRERWVFERYLALGGERLPQGGRWLTLEEYLTTHAIPRTTEAVEGELIPATRERPGSAAHAPQLRRDSRDSGRFRRAPRDSENASVRSQTPAVVTRTARSAPSVGAAVIRPTVDHRAAWEAHLRSPAFPRHREFLDAVQSAQALLHLRGPLSQYLSIKREGKPIRRTSNSYDSHSISTPRLAPSLSNGLDALSRVGRWRETGQTDTSKLLSAIDVGVLSKGGAVVRTSRLLRWCAWALAVSATVGFAAVSLSAGNLGWMGVGLTLLLVGAPFAYDAATIGRQAQTHLHQVWQVSGREEFMFWLWIPTVVAISGVGIVLIGAGQLRPDALMLLQISLQFLAWCMALATARVAPVRELLLGLTACAASNAGLLLVGGSPWWAVAALIVVVPLTFWMTMRLDETMRAALQVNLGIVKADLVNVESIARRSIEVVPLPAFTQGVRLRLAAIDSELALANSVLERLPEASRATALTNLSMAINGTPPRR